MPPSIDRSALEPCDILMCYGNLQPLSSILRSFDGGSYSHGALYCGESPDREVIEARFRLGEEGIYYLPLDDLCQMSDYIDVYRYHDENDGTLPAAAHAAIRARADQFVQDEANYDVVYSMLLLIPSLVDRLDLDEDALRAAREEIDALMAEIDRFIDGEKQRLVCTELVYLSYAEAYDDHRYALQIQGS